MQESILLQQDRFGTKVIYFSQNEKINDIYETFLSYIVFNGNKQPIKFYNSLNDNIIWQINDQNIYEEVRLQSKQYVVTGYMFTEILDYSIDQSIKNSIKGSFLENVGNTLNSDVYFYDQQVNDYFVNVKIDKSFSTLDTLSINNDVINSTPTQESKTGVIIGKLQAIQKINDINGNKVVIPIKNTSIGIFNPSEQFPSITDNDENGNRITMNFSSLDGEQKLYFDDYAKNFNENQILYKKPTNGYPKHYKFCTKTNENGEFVIYDVPIGSQVLFFEVDLFKQGLTKDEISYNFFSFPTDESPNLGDIPSLFFRQFPVSVVPSWGISQSGYTEIDINVNLDLRKWTTYYIPYSSIESDSFDLSTNFIKTVEIKDMTAKNFQKDNVQVIQIENLELKDKTTSLLWDQEIPQIKNKIQFYTSGYHAFKLPANIYSPSYYHTDISGYTANNYSGIWISSYQIKMHYDKPDTSYRCTGFVTKSILSAETTLGVLVYNRSHFNLNTNNDNYLLTGNTNPNATGDTSLFPYEFPWSYNYPEPFNTPHIPNLTGNNQEFIDYINTKWADYPNIINFFINTSPNKTYFYDGDLAYGYGRQEVFSGISINNSFSYQVTSGNIFKYEKNLNNIIKYSNGYSPFYDDAYNKIFGQVLFGENNFEYLPYRSDVINGDKYQRLEAGYGYFLRPSDWSKITNNSVDTIFTSTTITNLFKKDITLNFSQPFEGGFDIYRIINPNDTLSRLDVLNDKLLYATFDFQNLRIQNGGSALFPIAGRNQILTMNYYPVNSLEEMTAITNNVVYYNSFEIIKNRIKYQRLTIPGPYSSIIFYYPSENYDFGKLSIKNNGKIKSKIIYLSSDNIQHVDEINIGETFYFDINDPNYNFDNFKITLSTNDNYNQSTFSYMNMNYKINFENITSGIYYGTSTSQPLNYDIEDINLTLNINKNTPIFYLKSRYKNVGVRSNSVNKDCSSNNFLISDNIEIDGILFQEMLLTGSTIIEGVDLTDTFTLFSKSWFSENKLDTNNPNYCIGKNYPLDSYIHNVTLESPMT